MYHRGLVEVNKRVFISEIDRFIRSELFLILKRICTDYNLDMTSVIRDNYSLQKVKLKMFRKNLS